MADGASSGQGFAWQRRHDRRFGHREPHHRPDTIAMSVDAGGGLLALVTKRFARRLVDEVYVGT